MSVALSFFTYRYVEYYARQQEGYGFSLLMVLLALTLAAWGYYVQQQKGLPERSEIQRITSNLESLKKPKARDDKCVHMVKSIVNETVYLSHCRLNVVGSNSAWMALIGDSHAYVMYPGIATQMVKQGMNTILMSRNSCPTLLGGARGESESHIKHCEKAIKQTYKVLDSVLNLQQVVIVSRGPVYINEKGYGAIETNPTLKPRRYKSYYENRPYSAEKVFYQSLEDSIRYFYARNIKVSVMLENPELGFDIKQCIRRPFGLLPAKCRVSFKEYQNRMGEYRHNMKNIISKYENVHLLDPEPYMCDGDFCYGKDEDNILYADDDHLSVYGSEYLAEKFFNEARK